MFPKLIDFGEYFLPTYGVLVATAFLVGLWITLQLARRTGLNGELVTNLVVYSALSGMLGAKILMILFDWDHFSQNPGEIFSLATLQAAGVYQGGLILAIIVAFFYLRTQKLSWLPTFDTFAPGIAIGHAIGRIGCFAAGCCWGERCDLPWAVTFRNQAANALTGVPLNIPIHPSQLYEVATNILLFAYLWWRFGKPHRTGTIIGQYLVFGSIARFLIEFTRHHEQALPFGLPFSITQWIALGLALLGVGILMMPKSTDSAGTQKPLVPVAS
ncbi:MAG: prolipoprotein diacylglyceryl transferase [Bryobacteraceae bacterium]